MFNFYRALMFASLCAVAVSQCRIFAADAVSPGTTRIAKWKDEKKAAFMLFFDDSMPSHVKNVIPELKGRNLIATFYVNPGKGEWGLFKEKWEKDIPAMGMIYGNHTYTHKGVKDMADAEEEFGKCNEVIMKLHPEYKKPCLISYGTPGVKQGAWNITQEQVDQLLKEHHLVLRTNINPRFAFIHLKTADDMLKVVDNAIAKGIADCVAFHGVGGEWLSIPMPMFVTFLNGLCEKREQLWITDHISIHKYDTERSSAEVQVVEASDKAIRLKLSSKVDPQLYDAPLTLFTQVPESWKKVQVVQGAVKTNVNPANGNAKFEAVPGNEPIILTAAAE